MKRYHELDSIRGLAALSVVFAHYLNTFQSSTITTLIEYGPLRLLVSGNEAVLLFFLLSGFVLSLPFLKGRPVDVLNYRNFAVKRIARIYIPYIVAIVLAILCNHLFYIGSIDSLSSWFNNRWSAPVTFDAILQHLIFLGDYPKQFNVVTWSLVEELRISLIFPLLMIFVLRLNWKGNLLFTFSVFLLSVIIRLTFGDSASDISGTVSYSAIFILGALLAKYKDDLIKYVSNFSNRNKVLFLLAGLFLYAYGKPSFALSVLFSLDAYYRTVIDFWFTVTGAAIVVVASLSLMSVSKFLEQRVINFIGKISFSVYLYHLIILLSFVYMFNNVLPIWLILILSFACTIGISALSYFYIEVPSIKLGNNIVSRFKKTVNVKHDQSKAV